VNWYLAPGATISASGNFDLFTDAGGATSYTMSGSGKINLTGHGSCFIISNASSVIHVWASEVNQVSGSAPLGAAEGGFYQTAGEFHIKANKISGTVSAAYWDSGICYVEADLLLGNGSIANAIYSQSSAAGQHMHVDAKEIRNTAASTQVISIDGDPTSAFWITAQKIIGYDYLIRRAGPKLYINTQKLEATTTRGSTGMIDSEGGGFLYLTAQKVEALASSGAATSLFYLKDSDSYIDILQMVCSGVTDGVTITDNSGNHFLKIGRIDTQGNGIVFGSETGSASFVGTDITSGSTKKDITQVGGGLLLVRACSYDPAKTTGTITQGDPTFASYQPLDSDLTSWAGVTRASGFDTFATTPSGANFASLLTTALPASKGGTGLTALGTGVATSLGTANNSAGGYSPIDGMATLSNKTLASPKITTGLFDTNGNSMLAFTATASSIFGFTLTNAASGGTVALGVTAPTQATAGIVGTPLSLSASNAVAGSGTAGAVAGGAVTVQAGNAARLTSGNAVGGDINLNPGARIGTSNDGAVVITSPNNTSSYALKMVNGTHSFGFYTDGNNNQNFATENGTGFVMNTAAGPATKFALGSTGMYGFSSSGTPTSASIDTALYRNAAGVVEVNNGTAGTFRELKARSVIHSGVTIANLPASPTAGQVAYVTDGDASLAWGATAVNSGSGATKYLVWYNGTNWTVLGK
jgi:hypothetical protein